MFNEIVLDHNNQPHNPMVNSGAIMSASILLYLVKPEMNVAQKYDYVFDFFKVCYNVRLFIYFVPLGDTVDKIKDKTSH